MTSKGEDQVVVDGLRASICRFVGCMDAEELREVDAFVMARIRERHDWARHAGDPRWHFVLAFTAPSVRTACNGAWPTSDEYQIKARPPLAERCSYCQEQYAAVRRDRLPLEIPFATDPGAFVRNTAGAPDGNFAIDAGLAELRDAVICECYDTPPALGCERHNGHLAFCPARETLDLEVL